MSRLLPTDRAPYGACADEESGAAHRDLEEAGMEVFRVSIAELRAIILRGDLQTPSLCLSLIHI